LRDCFRNQLSTDAPEIVPVEEIRAAIFPKCKHQRLKLGSRRNIYGNRIRRAKISIALIQYLYLTCQSDGAKKSVLS